MSKRIIKFYADWCGSCKVLERILEENNIKYENVDIGTSKGETLALEYGVRNIPALLVLDESDELIEKFVGANIDVEYLKTIIDETN